MIIFKIKLHLLRNHWFLEPHTHLLFITPYEKQSKIKEKEELDINTKSYDISFYYDSFKFEYCIDTSNHPYIKYQNISPSNTSGIVGPNFWNRLTREINLGRDGLRLTVTKAVIKGKSRVCVEKMKEIREISKDTEIDYSKVCLGLKICQIRNSVSSLLDERIVFSDDVIDKGKFINDI